MTGISNDADAEWGRRAGPGSGRRPRPKKVPAQEYLGACYDAGLSWVHFPEGLGGLGVSRGLQAVADRILQGAGGPVPLGLNPMGYGMAAPTIREHAQTEDVKRQWLRPLATTEACGVSCFRSRVPGPTWPGSLPPPCATETNG